jgi:AraC family transcriptional regulator
MFYTGGGAGLPMDANPAINLVDIETLTVASSRKKGGYALIPVMIMELFGFITEKGIPPAGPPIYLWHEGTVEAAFAADAAGTADIEIVVPVAGKFPPVGDISCYQLPGGRMARVMHRGPYLECTTTYKRLFTWIREQGLEITGPIREIYHNDPREVKPEEILTEILAPVG